MVSHTCMWVAANRVKGTIVSFNEKRILHPVYSVLRARIAGCQSHCTDMTSFLCILPLQHLELTTFQVTQTKREITLFSCLREQSDSEKSILLDQELTCFQVPYRSRCAAPHLNCCPTTKRDYQTFSRCLDNV